MINNDKLYEIMGMIENIFNKVDEIDKDDSYLKQLGNTTLENTRLRELFEDYAILISYAANNYFQKMGLTNDLDNILYQRFVLQFLTMKFHLLDEVQYKKNCTPPKLVDYGNDLTYSEYGLFKYQFSNAISNKEDKWGEKHCYVRVDVPPLFLMYELIHEMTHATFCTEKQEYSNAIVIPMGLKEYVYHKDNKKTTTDVLPIVFDEAITSYIGEGILLEVLGINEKEMVKLDLKLGNTLKEIKDEQYYDSLGNCLVVPYDITKMLMSNQKIKQAIMEFLVINHHHEKLDNILSETLLPENAFAYLSNLYQECYTSEKEKLQKGIDIQNRAMYTPKEKAILSYIHGVIGLYNMETELTTDHKTK